MPAAVPPEVPLGRVVAVARDDAHRYSKPVVDQVTLVENHGVDGDVHAGATVRHRSARRRDAEQPNLRQVHLLHAELLDEVAADGFEVAPGQMGENVTTRGIPLLDLPDGTVLRLGDRASVRVTGIRNPCRQIDEFSPGLLKRVVDRNPDGSVRRLTGVMSVVLTSGEVRAGDPIVVELPPEPHRPPPVL